MIVRRSFLALDAKGGVIRNKSQRKIQKEESKEAFGFRGRCKEGS